MNKDNPASVTPQYEDVLNELTREHPVVLGFREPESQKQALICIRNETIHVIGGGVERYHTASAISYARAVNCLEEHGFFYDQRYL